MKRIFSILFALVLVLSLSLIPAAPMTAAAITVILYGNIAALCNAQGSNAEQYLGNGSWQAISNTKMELYIDPTSPPFDSLSSFTIGQIDSISYVTKNSGTPANVDFSLNIYTLPYSGGDSTWYGNRLSAEPLYSNNYNAPANQWNIWSTGGGTNQLKFYDSNHTVAGFYNGPTLADVKAGVLDWGTYPTSGSTDTIDYSTQTVKFIVFVTSTGGNWTTFNGFLDKLIINLTNGASITIDLEGLPVEVEIDIKPGSDPNSINPKSKGVIPVAILGSDTFDVTDVDVTTLQFGPGGATPAHDLTDSDVYNDHLEDVNDDGFMDLVSHYRTRETGIDAGDTEATLTGQTTGSIPIQGSDSIRTVGKP